MTKERNAYEEFLQIIEDWTSSLEKLNEEDGAAPQRPLSRKSKPEGGPAFINA